MAAPNIVGVSTIIGITSCVSVDTTGTTTLLLSNPASSGAVYKINNITLSNVSNSTVGFTTIRWHNTAAGIGNSFSITSNVGVATGTSLVVLDKASSIYLEENKSITVQVSNAGVINAVCSYEKIQ